jgi:hypothetical protein
MRFFLVENGRTGLGFLTSRMQVRDKVVRAPVGSSFIRPGFLHGGAAGTRERLTCARLRSYQSHSLPFRCPVSRPVLTAHGVRITAVVAVERIVGSTHGSNAKPRFQGMAATARAINGTAAVERTRAGVNVTRETAPNYSAYRGKADWIPTSLFTLVSR